MVNSRTENIQHHENRVQLIKFKIMKSPLCDKLLIPSSAKFKELYSWYIANCVLNAFLTITAIILNSITIHAIQKTPSLPKPLKTLLLSLAVSDLGVGLVVQPFYFGQLVKWLKRDIKTSLSVNKKLVCRPVYTLTTYVRIFISISILFCH